MMPTALIEASSCSSIAAGTGVRRGLFGLIRRVVGSTLRSSAMACSCLVGVLSSLNFGKTPPARRIPIRRGKGARSARPQAGPLRRRTAMRQPSQRCRFFPFPLLHSVFVFAALAACLSPVAIGERAGRRLRG